MPARLTAIAINCSLSASGRASSTDAMLGVLAEHFAAHDVDVGKPVRIAAHKVKWGVTSDEGPDDDWPAIREQILAAVGETDEKGRMPSYSKVAVAAIVGNEDGAHHVASQLFQSLNDVGWTIPAVAACYWVGEAMGSLDFKDLDHRPRKVTETAKMVAANTAHLARLLRDAPYPG